MSDDLEMCAEKMSKSAGKYNFKCARKRNFGEATRLVQATYGIFTWDTMSNNNGENGI